VIGDPFEVVWSADARADWRRLPLDQAEAVAVAVHNYATRGEASHMILVNHEFLMFVGELVVVMLVDGNALHVDQVRRS